MKQRKQIRTITCKSMLLLLFIILCLGACGSEKSETVSMYDLRKSMLQADESFPDMLSVSDEDTDAQDLFAYVSEVDYDKIEHFFLSYSSEGLADEIVVATAKNINDIEEIKESFEEHKKSRIKLYNQYMPKEQERAEQAVIFVKQQYVVLIIAQNSDAVKEAFENAVEK